MAHTPEACARRILEVFRDFNVRADEHLRIGSFTNYFVATPWRMEDFNTGVDEAMRLGWTVDGSSEALFLTALGESEIT